MQIKAGGGSVIKTNIAATTNPGTGDDTGSGYAIGSIWFNVTLDRVFFCVDATAAAAVWIEIGGAPVGADYLVGTADAELTGEIVVGATPGGELGNTWASPTVDATHAGGTHPTEASKANMEAEATGFLVAPPDLIKNSPGITKFQCMIAAVGTLQSGSYNVASIGDTGTGDRNVVVDTDYADTNYAVGSTVWGAQGTPVTTLIDNLAVGSFDILLTETDGDTAVDRQHSVFGWGDQ